MIKKKGGPARGSKTTGGRETTWLREEDAVRAIRKLIKSMNMDAEQKITLEDGINNLANEVESMIGRIDMATTTTYRKNLLVAYKKFLEQNIEVVNQLLKAKD
jgi:hypothetical protein